MSTPALGLASCLPQVLLWADSLTSVAPGLSLVRKVLHLQVVFVVKAVWDIFDNTNGSMFTS